MTFPDRHSTEHRLISLLVVLMGSSGCGYDIHRQPAAPASLPPRIPAAPPPQIPGTGRVAIEVLDGPTQVQWLRGVRSVRRTSTRTHYRTRYDGAIERIVETSHYSDVVPNYRPVCATPCVADLPLGRQTLRFVPIEDGVPNELQNDFAEVTFTARPAAYRRVLTRIRVNPEWHLGRLAFLCGVLADLAGPTLLFFGDPAKVDPVPLGLSITAGGIALTALGLWAILEFQTDLWPGVGVQWQPVDDAYMEVGHPRRPVRRPLDDD